MKLTFACNGCGKTIRVPDSASGKPVRCPNCNRVTIAPLEPTSSEINRVELPDSRDNPYGSTSRTPAISVAENVFQAPIAACSMEIERFQQVRLPPHRMNFTVPGILLCIEAGIAIPSQLLVLQYSLGFGIGWIPVTFAVAWGVVWFLFQVVILLGGIALLMRRAVLAARLAAIMAIFPAILLSGTLLFGFGILIYLIGLVGGLWALNSLAEERNFDDPALREVNNDANAATRNC